MQQVQVASVDVTPGQATIGAGSTQQFSVVTRDASGAALSGRTVSWSSSSNAIATVTNGGLATGVGEGTATITATSEGVSGTAQLTVELGAFSPTANTSLSGNQVFTEVNIPDGVTVTATGPLNLTVEGPITIDGDLTGECVEISLEGEGSIDLSGDIDNDCTAP